jgi:hypothetical protein
MKKYTKNFIYIQIKIYFILIKVKKTLIIPLIDKRITKKQSSLKEKGLNE